MSLDQSTTPVIFNHGLLTGYEKKMILTRFLNISGLFTMLTNCQNVKTANITYELKEFQMIIII